MKSWITEGMREQYHESRMDFFESCMGAGIVVGVLTAFVVGFILYAPKGWH